VKFQFPYEFRKYQKQTIAKILKAIEDNKVVALSAPTGFGKTIVALYSALLHSLDKDYLKILYLVRTKSEVNPPIRELYRLYKVNSLPQYTFVINKMEMCYHINTRNLQQNEIEENLDFYTTCNELRNSGQCNIRKIKFKEFKCISDYIMRCVKKGVCPYYNSLLSLSDCKVVVLTYPYIFNPRIYNLVRDVYDIDIGSSILILDEAHNIEAIAANIELSLTKELIRMTLHEIDRYVRQGLEVEKQIVQTTLNNLLNFILKHEGKSLKYVGLQQFMTEFPDIFSDMFLMALNNLHSTIYKIKRKIFGVNARTYIKHIMNFIDNVLNLETEYMDLFVSENGIAIKCIDYTYIMKRINKAYSVIMMSGTLPPKSFLKYVYGIKRDLEYIEVPNIFPRKNRLYVIDDELTSKYELRSESMYRRYAQKIVEIRRSIPEKYVVLVVYPSYEFMKNILKHYEKIPKETFDIVETERLRIDDVIKQAIENNNVVIHAVAGGKISEGIEIVVNKKSKIGCVVIAGLPYPEPNDYTQKIFDYLRVRYGDERAFYFTFIVPAIVKTRQAFGRAIRSERDKAIFIVLDKRAKNERIRKMLKIPKNHIQFNTNEIYRFFTK